MNNYPTQSYLIVSEFFKIVTINIALLGMWHQVVWKKHTDILKEYSTPIFRAKQANACFLHLLVACLSYSSTLWMEGRHSSKMSMNFYWTIWCHILEDHNLSTYHFENQEYHICTLFQESWKRQDFLELSLWFHSWNH